jgi:hypothetical protein
MNDSTFVSAAVCDAIRSRWPDSDVAVDPKTYDTSAYFDITRKSGDERTLRISDNMLAGYSNTFGLEDGSERRGTAIQRIAADMESNDIFQMLQTCPNGQRITWDANGVRIEPDTRPRTP